MASVDPELILELEKRGADPELVSELRIRSGVKEGPGLLRGAATDAAEAMMGAGRMAADVVRPLTDRMASAAGALGESAGESAEIMGRAGVPAPLSALSMMPAALAGELAPKTPIELALMATPLGEAPKEALKIGGMAAEKLTPTFARAIKAAANFKVTPTLAEITGSKFFGQMEARLEKLPFAGPIIDEFKQRNLVKLSDARNVMLERFGPQTEKGEMGAVVKAGLEESLGAGERERISRLDRLRQGILGKYGKTKRTEALGNEIKSVVEKESQRVSAEAKALYDKVDDAINPALNSDPATNLRDIAQKILKEQAEAPTPTLSNGIMGRIQKISEGPASHVPEAGDVDIPPAIQEIIGKRTGYTYGGLNAFRSDLRQLLWSENPALALGSGQKGTGTPDGRAIARLMNALDTDIDSFAGRLGGGVKHLNDISRAFYRGRYKGRFDTDLIRDIAKKEPEQVYDFIVNQGSLEDVRTLKNVVGPVQFNNLRSKMVQDIIGGEEIPNATEIMKRISDRGPVLDEFLQPHEIRQLKAFAKTAEVPAFVETEIEKRLRKIKNLPDNRAVAQAVISGDADIARNLKKVVGNNGLQPFRRKIIENILGVADGEIKSPAKIANELNRYPESFLNEMFDPDTLKSIREIGAVRDLLKPANVLAANASGTGSSGAGTLLAMTASAAGGAGYWLMRNPLAGAGASLFVSLSPAAIAKIYTSPMARKLIVEGFSIPATDRRAAQIGARIAAYAGVKMGHKDGKPLSKYR